MANMKMVALIDAEIGQAKSVLRAEAQADIAVALNVVDEEIERLWAAIELERIKRTNLHAVVSALYQHLDLTEPPDEAAAEQTHQEPAPAAAGADQNEASGAAEEPAEAVCRQGEN